MKRASIILAVLAAAMSLAGCDAISYNQVLIATGLWVKARPKNWASPRTR
jgi:hypothetical protein